MMYSASARPVLCILRNFEGIQLKYRLKYFTKYLTSENPHSSEMSIIRLSVQSRSFIAAMHLA